MSSPSSDGTRRYWSCTPRPPSCASAAWLSASSERTERASSIPARSTTGPVSGGIGAAASAAASARASTLELHLGRLLGARGGGGELRLGLLLVHERVGPGRRRDGHEVVELLDRLDV